MSTQDQNAPAPGGQGSDEPTLVIKGPSSTSPEPERTTPVVPLSSEATVIGKTALRPELPEQQPEAASPSPSGPGANPTADQDTVVSPRLRQLAQTPSQPLRPPSGAPAKPSGIQQLMAGSSSRMIWLVGILGALILLVLILVVVIAVQRVPMLVAGLTSTKTPTPTATLAVTPTSVFPPTATKAPATPTQAPPTATPAPPTSTPRPAPTALAKDVLARVAPPEGIKLKVRDKASTTGAILGELAKDAQVTILEGPTDANGIKWWKVDDGKGLVGWSAEGLGTDKYLVPVGWAK
jgi:uncharacterized integral membrane protein